MLIVLLLIFVSLAVVPVCVAFFRWEKELERKKEEGGYISYSDKNFYFEDEVNVGIFTTSVILSCGLFLIMCGLLGTVVNGRQIDNKIALYEETNSQIETKIQMTISDFMGYEKDVFANTDLNMVVLRYPELKSDALVQEELKVYQENNNKIVQLRESKIDINVAKWWLYFGGE